MERRWILPAILILATILAVSLSLRRHHRVSSTPQNPASASLSSYRAPPPALYPSPSPSPVLVPISSLSPAPLGLPPFSLAPALFVLGDSTVDCGTNNFLGTLARADRLPYGRDFDTRRPTGRFSNGRIIVDYLAIRLGLPFVPPFLGQSGRVEDMVRGLNYASAAAGIIFSSGYDLVEDQNEISYLKINFVMNYIFQGQRISLTQQIQQTSDTFQQLALSLGEAAAADLISRSVFYVSIGSNDFIHYYLRNVSGVQSLYQPSEFNQLLTDTVQQELKNLYNANVRKVVVMGLAPIGCTPHYLWQWSEHGECVESINNLVVDFNSMTKNMVGELNKELTGVTITFCDAFNASMDIMANRNRYGFSTTTEACCGLGRYGGLIMCLIPEMACSDASTHVWWDEFHPTEAVNRILADDVWSGMHTNMCYPMNLEKMVRLDLV